MVKSQQSVFNEAPCESWHRLRYFHLWLTISGAEISFLLMLKSFKGIFLLFHELVSIVKKGRGEVNFTEHSPCYCDCLFFQV